MVTQKAEKKKTLPVALQLSTEKPREKEGNSMPIAAMTTWETVDDGD